MRFILYPHDIERSTSDTADAPGFQGGFYAQMKQHALYFKSHDASLISAAAVAMMNTAYHFGCEVRFIQDGNGRYEQIIIESKKELAGD